MQSHSNGHPADASPERGGQVHVVQRMEPGGIQTLILDMLRARQNPADRIYSLEWTTDELIADWPRLEAERDHLVGFAYPGGKRPDLSWQMAKRLRQDRPRSVVVHHIGPMLYGSLAARLAGIRALIHVEHDVWHYEEQKNDRVIASSVSRLLRPRHVAVSQPIADKMREIVGGRPVAVIPPAIDTDAFQPADRSAARQKLGLPVDAKLVGSVGRLAEVKAFDLLIDAVAMLPESVHLVLVGDGPERDKLEARAGERKVTERVHFLGLRTDIPDILPGLDLFCLSSHNEGLPRVVLEAQACDLPVLATDVGALKDGVCPETGLLVPAGSAEALAEGLRRQLERDIPEGASRRFVIERYGFASMMQAYDRQVEGRG